MNMKKSVFNSLVFFGTDKRQCVSHVAPLLVLCTMLLLEGSMAKHVTSARCRDD